MVGTTWHFRVAKYNDLTSDDISIWKRYVEYTDAFKSPLLQPEYTQALAKVRDDVEIGVAEQHGVPVGFLPFHRVKPTYGLPIGASVSDGHAILTAEGTVIDEVAWLKGFGLARFDFDHLVGQIAEKYVHRYDTCYRIRLDSDFDAFQNEGGSRSSFQKQIARKHRKLERDFTDVQVLWKVTSPTALRNLIQWKSEDLIARGYANPFADCWVTDLVSDLWQLEEEDMSGLLSGLMVDGNFAALHFGVVNRSCLVSWLPCVNPAFQRYSPGGILLYRLAKVAWEKGIGLIDLGRGENQTKVRLANDRIEMAIGSICTSPITLAMTRFLATSKQRLKRLRQRFF